MHDFIGAYERINRVYRMYIESAFPMRYQALVNDRRSMLSQQGILSQPPLLETIPIYPQSGYNLVDASKALPLDYRDLQYLARELLPSDIELYKHQWQSLGAVLKDQRDIVVTTGTGSGKTECFLLPLLAELARESADWPACPPPPSGRKWWENGDDWAGQWAHSKREHAVRAMILYPLNALVEDQLRRLRKTLDSEDVHLWLDAHRRGNRILFGRYTGLTPVPGDPSNEYAVDRLHDRLTEMAGESEEARRMVRENPDVDPDLLYYFPNIDGGEMWSRWDMQQTPPDILITNYSMLNIMLMRQVEACIFDRTREWLAGDSRRRFFLIVDELHSYRGTAGTEVSYILRLLFQRLGLDKRPDQLGIMATSASLDDSNPRSKEFLRQFFGRKADRFEIISDEQVLPEKDARFRLAPFQSAFERFVQKVQPDLFDPMVPPNSESKDVQEAMSELATALGKSPHPEASPKVALADVLLEHRTPDAIRDACAAASADGSVRPVPVPELDGVLFPDANTGQTASDAMRGLLLAVGMSQIASGTSPQPVRGHLFLHNLQNLWVCANPNCNDPSCDTIGRQQFEQKVPVGSLHPRHRIACSCGGRVLDLIVCEVCGDIFLGGFRAKQRVGKTRIEILTADQPELEKMPDRFSIGQKCSSYAVFWPSSDEPLDLSYQADQISRRWARARLNVFSGVLRVGGPPAAAQEIDGWVYVVAEDHPDEPAMPHKCPRCDADYRRRKYFPTPLRNHRTGFQKSCQVISSAVCREMPLVQNERKGRKLIIFSDSRQDAAKLAAGMEKDHFQDMTRLALISRLRDYWRQFEAFVRTLLRQFPNQLAKIKDANPDLHETITRTDVSADDLEFFRQFQSTNPLLAIEMNNWLLDLPPTNQDAFDSLMKLIAEYPRRISLTQLIRAVREQLLTLGVSPASTRYSLSGYTVGSEREPWHSCFNWQQTPPMEKTEIPLEGQRLLDRMNSTLRAELMHVLFPHRVRTLEGLGQGWVTYQPTGEVSPKIMQATDAVIRLLGISRRYLHAEYFWAGSNEKLPKFARDYLERVGIDEEDVRVQLLDSRAGVKGAFNMGLDPDQLYLRLPSTSRSGWRCPNCNGFYLHAAGGKCSECKHGEDLVESSPLEIFDYYRYLLEGSGPAFRLHCEELTGQTDFSERLKRQRWFQEVFQENEIPMVHGVDLLSVTTTMESGVDIGSLAAVMMANMPPRRFNYQQRVGRAGRRGAGVSLAVTFCRGRSHDDYYYQRTEQMTGDPPPMPYVDMSSQPIFKRVLIKKVLRRAFETIPTSVLDGGRKLDSVHGSFGNASDWDEVAPEVQHFLDTNIPVIREVIDALRVETSWADGGDGTGQFCVEMIRFLQNELVDKITDVVNNPGYTQDAISERMANAGLLPMFGFPTRVRLLFTRWPRVGNPWPPQTGTVDRDMDIAISQFAPGSETVKDKAVHTACGVVELYPQGHRVFSRSGFVPDIDNAVEPIGRCESCQAVVRLHPTNSPATGGQEPSLVQCFVCGEMTLRPIDAREPKAFFTNLRPRDFDGFFEWTPRSTRPTLSIKNESADPVQVGNTIVSAFEGEILSINDNDGQGGFDFQQASIYGEEQPGAYAVSPEPDRVTVSGPAYRIALLSKRRTDVLLVDIPDLPDGVFADPLTVEGRAAWYSFAFCLRTAASAELDVDPTEFDAGFRSIARNGRPIGQAFLSDKLENGAGYSRWFGEPANFQKLLDQVLPNDVANTGSLWLDDSHYHTCDTSCNRCLRDFYNSGYHGLLDWRLALDMTRLAMSSSAAIDLFTPWEAYENPWRNLLSSVSVTMQQLGFQPPEAVNQSNVYVHKNLRRKRIWIERHPLWTDEHPNYVAVADEVQKAYPNHEIQPMNPFMALRRPSDYV